MRDEAFSPRYFWRTGKAFLWTVSTDPNHLQNKALASTCTVEIWYQFFARKEVSEPGPVFTYYTFFSPNIQHVKDALELIFVLTFLKNLNFRRNKPVRKFLHGLARQVRIYFPVLCWNFKTIYGGSEQSRKRVVVPAHKAAQPGGIGSLGSILGLLKSLKIRAKDSGSTTIKSVTLIVTPYFKTLADPQHWIYQLRYCNWYLLGILYTTKSTTDLLAVYKHAN
jgi:hypothetical protein